MKHYQILLAALASTLLLACNGKNPLTPQKRAESFSQGAGQNLLSISTFDQKTFELQTFEVIGKTVTTKADKVSSDGSTEFNAFDLVRYQTDAKLLGEIPFRGRPHHKYQIQYRLTENYLKIFKLGDEKDIPIQERGYAEKMSDGRLAVPLAGYPIRSYLTIENAKNDDNEKTHVLLEMPVNSKALGTHFKIDENAIEIFRSNEKVDIFPANFLNGDWYFSETITTAGDDSEAGDMVGFGLASDGSSRASNKVRIVKTQNSIKAINLNVDDRVDLQNEVNHSAAIEIPVQWKAYKASTRGKDTSLAEEEDSTVLWQERPYVLLNLENVNSLLNRNSAAKVVDIEIAKDFFAFTLLNQQEKSRIKYAFMKVQERGYTPKKALKADQKIFGYFEQTKEFYKTYEKFREKDIEDNSFIQRFNPNKNIVFHFTTTTPQWLRPAAAQAIHSWNEGFKAAGSSIEVLIDESKDVELGDTRYNMINLVESINGGNYYGLAGTIVDPRTGEVISGTANVQVTPIRNTVISTIREYVLSKLNALDDKYIFGRNNSFPSMKVNNAALAPKSEVMQKIASKLATLGIVKPQNRPQSTKLNFKQSNYPTRNDSKEVATSYFDSDLLSIVGKQCPEVDAYIKRVNERNLSTQEKQLFADGEIAVLESCSRKITTHKMMGTLVHELGHTFGLRHNFYGSTDAANFYPASKGETQIQSSSVMEYPAFEEDRLTFPGYYDVAAIRFGYNNKIEIIESGKAKIVDLDTRKSIAQNLNEKKLQMRSFKYCTDEDVDYYNVDPMCARFDHGTTPGAVVDHIKEGFNSTVALYFNRYDRAYSERGAYFYNAANLGESMFENTFINLKKHYDKWRGHLAQYSGFGNEYLEKMTPQEYDKLLNNMKNDSRYAKIFADYYPASRKVYSFLMAIAQLPAKYCVATRSDQSPKIIPLESIRKEIFASTGASVTSCFEDLAQQKLTSQALKLVGETGYFHNDVKFNMSPERIAEANDVVGMSHTKLMAMLTLTIRIPELNAVNNANSFGPNFFDEPDLRQEMITKMISRVLMGVNSSELRIDGLAENKPLASFELEKDILNAYVPLLKMGLNVPGKITETQNRLSLLTPIIPRGEVPDQEGISKLSIGGLDLVATAEQPIAKAMIDQINNLQALKHSAVVNDKIFAGIKSTLMLNKVPKNALNSLSVSQYLNLVLELLGQVNSQIEKAQKDGSLTASDMQALQAILSPEQTVLTAIAKKAGIQDEEALQKFMASEEAKATVVKYLAIPTENAAKLDISFSAMDSRIKNLVEGSKKMVALKNDLGQDLEAQIDILTNSLLRD